VVLVLHQLAVPAGQQVAGLAEQLQRLLFVDVAEHRPLSRRAGGLWENDRRFLTLGNWPVISALTFEEKKLQL